MKRELTYNLRTIDFNMNDIITPYGILNYFQDIARLHASELGVGYDDTIVKNMIWVLTKTKFEIFADFVPESQIKVITWPSYIGKLDFNREYLITDLSGKTLAKGVSQWLVIDKDTKKILKSDVVDFPHAYDYDNYLVGKFDKVPKFDITEYNHLLTYKVANFDIDHNMHMNNANYARIIFDALDSNKISNIKTFEINYAIETMLGETLCVLACENQDGIFGQITNEDKTQTKTTFKITYQK